jgi:hypothetical protein
MKGGGIDYIRGASPLFDSPHYFRRRRGRDFREGRSPSLTYTPPSLNKGRGSGGIGYFKHL